MFAVPDSTIALAERAIARHPVRVALEVAADRDRWRHLLTYDPDERFSVLLEPTLRDEPHQEIWLMSWLPGQHTELHDHGDVAGAFTVVSGQLHETVARRAGIGAAVTELHELSAGQSRVFGPGYVHQVRNEGPDPAVTVHVYRSGPRTIRAFRQDLVDGPVPG